MANNATSASGDAVAPEGSFSDQELAAYIEEALPVERSVELETALRQSVPLQQRLRTLLLDVDQGLSGVGDIWRRRHVSCPSRTTWAAYLRQDLGAAMMDYLKFHLDAIACRYCAANVRDLQGMDESATERRVRKFFQTSVGRLPEAALRSDGHRELNLDR